VREAIVQSSALAIACLVSFAIVTQVLGHLYFISAADALLGGMWAVIATIFIYRLSYEASMTAAVSRIAATLVSFALCLAYLLILPFTVWGLAVLIGVGAFVMMLMGRPQDATTTGITTAVVMVVAALSPHNAWEQPILRLVDTVAGVAVGLAVAWIGLRAAQVRGLAMPSRP
jgi:uncharacterized membrane protein YccC